MDHAEVRKLHHEVDFVGLRAQATSVGFIQLCSELCRAGVLDEAALDRIKEAIARELELLMRDRDLLGQRRDLVLEGGRERVGRGLRLLVTRSAASVRMCPTSACLPAGKGGRACRRPQLAKLSSLYVGRAGCRRSRRGWRP